MLPELTGNETNLELIEALATLITEATYYGDQRVTTEVNGSDHNGWFTLRLPNGAEWQVSVVRSGWPQDGTSAQ